MCLCECVLALRLIHVHLVLSFPPSQSLHASLSLSPRVRSCVFVCMPPLFLSFSLFFSKALFIASIPLLALYHFHRLAFTTSRVMYRMFLLHSFSPPFRPSYVCVGKYSSYFTVLSCCPLFFVSFACFLFFFLGSLSVRFSVCVSGSDWGVFATFLSCPFTSSSLLRISSPSLVPRLISSFLSQSSCACRTSTSHCCLHTYPCLVSRDFHHGLAFLFSLISHLCPCVCACIRMLRRWFTPFFFWQRSCPPFPPPPLSLSSIPSSPSACPSQ